MVGMVIVVVSGFCWSDEVEEVSLDDVLVRRLLLACLDFLTCSSLSASEYRYDVVGVCEGGVVGLSRFEMI
jgi:hypothetical protein